MKNDIVIAILAGISVGLIVLSLTLNEINSLGIAIIVAVMSKMLFSEILKGQAKQCESLEKIHTIIEIVLKEKGKQSEQIKTLECCLEDIKTEIKKNSGLVIKQLNAIETENKLAQKGENEKHEELKQLLKSFNSAIETCMERIKVEIKNSNKLIGIQLKEFNNEYLSKIAAEYQINTKILQNIEGCLQVSSDFSKKFADETIKNQIDMFELQTDFKKKMTDIFESEMERLNEAMEDSIEGIAKSLRQNGKEIKESVDDLVDRSVASQTEFFKLMTDYTEMQKKYRDEVRSIVDEMVSLNAKDIEMMEKMIKNE